ncbi:16S rRNA (uracil(1498)-N(3))-methyltransferase [Candidatus Hydrogenedentota bacterium]
MNIILLTPEDLREDGTYGVAGKRAEHIRHVLRSKKGDTLEVGLLRETLGVARIELLGADEIVLRCTFNDEPLRALHVTDIICALPRPQTLKKVLVTAASMGVRHLHLVRANRVEKSFFHSSLLHPANMNKFIYEGLSQGKLVNPPEVIVHKYFKVFFEDTLSELEAKEGSPVTKILPHPEARLHIRGMDLPQQAKVAIAIGPEGGWVPFEVDLMRSLGFSDVRLGPWVLRVETALTAALAQVELVRGRQGDG